MRRRLVLVAAAITSMVALAFLVPLGLLLRSSTEERLVHEAEVTARSLAPVVATDDDPASLASAVELAAGAAPGQVSVHLDDGTTVGADAPTDAAVDEALTGEAVAVHDDGVHRTLIPVVRTDGTTAVVAVAVSDADLSNGVTVAWAMLAGLGVALVAGGVAVADRLGRSTVASVRELERLADRLGRGELGARADVADPPEVAAVADALHVLARRISRLLVTEREAVADLSHRVRTPLMALTLDLEALPPSPQRARLEADVERLGEAIDLVIRSARQGGAPAAVRRCDLAETVARRVAFWRVLADDQGRALDVDVRSTPAVPLRDDELAAAIDALLGNVFAHTPEGTDVRIHGGSGASGAQLVVEDDGPGFPHGHAPVRGVSPSGSTGLGLDIVRQTAERTGGEVVLGPSASGGARVEVRFGAGLPDDAAPELGSPSAGT